jgi:transcriptional repressor NrdR
MTRRRLADRLVCPHCDGVGDDVVNSRPSDDRTRIRRRRQCRLCGKRYTTIEQVEKPPRKPTDYHP